MTEQEKTQVVTRLMDYYREAVKLHAEVQHHYARLDEYVKENSLDRVLSETGSWCDEERYFPDEIAYAASELRDIPAEEL